MNNRCFYLATLWALLPLAALAQPALINYQGRLIEGTNLVNGIKNIALELYDQAAGGSLLYADSNNVTVVDGLYNTHIGDDSIAGDLATALAATSVWLQVVVDGTPLSPRERLVSVPYARQAQQTRGLSIPDNNAVVLLPVDQFALGNVTSNPATFATISGGSANQLSGNYAVIGGGQNNQARAGFTTIAGGGFNVVDGGNLGGATVGGGYQNQALGQDSTIAGGYGNVASGSESAIPGGRQNLATNQSFAAGTRAKAMHTGSFVWGDSTNADVSSTTNNQVTFRANGGFRVLGGAISGNAGGLSNFPSSVIANQAGAGTGRLAFFASQSVLADGSATLGGDNHVVTNGATYAVISGGFANITAGNNTLIGGGQENTIGSGAAFSVIGGGIMNSLTDNTRRAFLGGGAENQIEAEYGVLGGGLQNHIQPGASYGVLGGGELNQITTNATRAVLTGGSANRVGGDYAVVSGGYQNQANGTYATVPGGHLNAADGAYSFAAGRRAKATHSGSFVWGDGQNGNINSAANNEVRIRAGGGMHLVSGALNPAYLLTVAGAIRAEEVIVETGWADYVFEPDFVLRGLDEVEAHIAEKGHLPDVPSAAEIQQQGVSLGEMQTLMMQKIEELTLYIIEQNKRIAELEAAVHLP